MEETVRAIDRAFTILENLATADHPLSLVELVAATGMSKSTIHRLLATLLARHYVAKREDAKYTIGYKLVEMVSSHINGLELLTEAKPFLAQISKGLNLTAHLGVLDGTNVVYIEEAEVYPAMRNYTEIGCHSPAYCSSIGKCLLAGLSGEELDAILFDYKFTKFTANTIASAVELKRLLRVVRKQGWAMDNEEYQEGHRCVGAPIYDFRGNVVAALAASGDLYSLPNEKLAEVIKRVKTAAEEISRRLGYVM